MLWEHQEIWVDTVGEMTLEGLRAGRYGPGRDVDPAGFLDLQDFHVWHRTNIVNRGSKIRQDYLVFSCCTEHYRIFVVRDGEVVSSHYSEEGRLVADYQSSTLLTTEPGDSVTVYFQGYSEVPVSELAASQLQVSPNRRVVGLLLFLYGQYFTYLGLMLGICISSLIFWFLFRRSAFAWFAAFAIALPIYLININGFRGYLPFEWLTVPPIRPVDFAILSLIVSLTGFTYRFLELGNPPDRFSRWYLVMGGLTVGIHLIMFLWWPNRASAILVGNVLLVLWSILIIWACLREARRGSVAARAMLYSISGLFVAAVSYISLLVIHPELGSLGGIMQLGSIAFSGVIFYALFSQVRAERSRTEQLKAQNAMRSTFFANISHEFRTPLTLILGPLKQLRDRLTDPKDRQLLEVAHRNGTRQLDLVNQVLELSRLEAGQLTLQRRETELVSLLRRVTNLYASAAEQREITLSFSATAERVQYRCDPEQLERVVNNLLSNALKFTPAGGFIAVGLTTEPARGGIEVSVTDSGPGIPVDQEEQIFDRFFTQGSGEGRLSVGTGIGLSVSRELVQLHEGRIFVATPPEGGARFTVWLPETYVTAIQSHPAAVPEEAPVAPAVPATAAVTEPVAPRLPSDRPLVLVVEDHPDLRGYLESLLSARYRVVTAENGRTGLELAREHLPQLVISDVMMPDMDGYALCAALKTDLLISHVPVILLTARAAREDRLDGLRTGADDYLTKPFDADELLLRAGNLIRSRRLLRERFADSLSLRPSEVTATEVDREFLETAVSTVERHMEDADSNLDVLARELGMSRASLNRKFRALLDQSSNQFVQGVRLERGAELLRKESLTVGEVALRTGFGSTAYFGKLFRARFGQTPGEYRAAASS